MGMPVPLVEREGETVGTMALSGATWTVHTGERLKPTCELCFSLPPSLAAAAATALLCKPLLTTCLAPALHLGMCFGLVLLEWVYA